jgi:signal transduction histidine kinase
VQQQVDGYQASDGRAWPGKAKAFALGSLSLRGRVMLLVIASVVPLLVFSLANQYLRYREEVTATRQQALELAHGAATMVESELRIRLAALEVLSISRALRELDLAAFRAEAEQVAVKHYPGSNILLLRAQGQILLNTRIPPGELLPVRPELETTREVLATGEPGVSNLYRGIRQRFIVSIDVPVKREDGRIDYVLSFNPRLDDFVDVIRQQQLPAKWVVTISDRKGVIIARMPHSDEFIGQDIGPRSGELIAARVEGSFEGVSLDGVPTIGGVGRSAQFGWSVTVGVPRSEVIGPAVSGAIRTLLAGLGILAVSIALALIVARQITRPIAMLRQLVSRADPQMLLAAPPTGLREADELAHALRTAEQGRRRSLEAEQRAHAALLASEEKLRQSQKMEAVGQLTGGLAHDFNNLLLVVIGSLDLVLESGKGGEETQQLVQEAHTAAQRGADLIRSLLAFARRQQLRPRRVEINALVSNLNKLLSRTLGERVEISLAFAPDLWPVVVDPAGLEAALTNLATNARDAMPKGGRLTIATANCQLDEDYASQHAEVTPGDYAMIEVSDTGAGMSPVVMARIFDPFFSTKPRGQGTGLGLSMAFGFMKQSGGHINVYSEVGVGTTFRVYLPRDRRDAKSDVKPAATADVPRGSGETVLVVEDNDMIARLVATQLNSLGYEVRQAANAATALDILKAGERIDLVFADVVMPGQLDGFDLAEEVHAAWPGIKVVLTSGFPGTNHGNRISNLPLLTKPYHRDELARTVRNALNELQPAAAPSVGRRA